MKKVAGNRKNKKLKNGEQSMKMIFETPATVWQEAFPLGNGRIGALMFGDGEAETLCLNEDTLWSGYPGDPRTGMGYEDIKKAEVYAKEGSYLQATQVLNQAQETAEDVEMYEPFGTVRILSLIHISDLRENGKLQIIKENWILRRQLPG